MEDRVAVVTVECIGCKTRREIKAGEVPEGEYPVCAVCYMPVLAVKAEVRKKPKRRDQ